MKVYLVAFLLLLQACTLQPKRKSACESVQPLLEDVQNLLNKKVMNKAQREEFWDLYYVLTVNCSYDGYDSEEAALKTAAELETFYNEVVNGQAKQ